MSPFSPILRTLTAEHSTMAPQTHSVYEITLVGSGSSNSMILLLHIPNEDRSRNSIDMDLCKIELERFVMNLDYNHDLDGQRLTQFIPKVFLKDGKLKVDINLKVWVGSGYRDIPFTRAAIELPHNGEKETWVSAKGLNAYFGGNVGSFTAVRKEKNVNCTGECLRKPGIDHKVVLATSSGYTGYYAPLI